MTKEIKNWLKGLDGDVKDMIKAAQQDIFETGSTGPETNIKELVTAEKENTKIVREMEKGPALKKAEAEQPDAIKGVAAKARGSGAKGVRDPD
jgi:hypothetical protein